MESILTVIRDYGALVYGLLFAYSVLKSGTLPLFAGIAAQAGALDVVGVAVAVFAGGYLGDELRFGVARRHGPRLLQQTGRMAAMVGRATALLARHGRWYIFLYRYPKGLRTVGALPLGLGPMAWPEFTMLNGASAALWTAAMVGLGYSFGETISRAVETGFGMASVALLALFLVLSGLVWWLAGRVDASTGTLPGRGLPP
jgi:membrane protein DedA with SNARE-associated domain